MMPIRKPNISRRRYQRGTLIDDKERWCCRFREDVLDPTTGKVVRKHRWDVLAMKKDCPNKRQAQRLLDERLAEVNSENYRPVAQGDFAAFADRWQKHILPHHKASSQRSEKSVISKHLIPVFGQWSLKEITTEALQEYVTEHPASPKTVANIIAVLRTMFETARQWSYCTHNPFEGLRLPKQEGGGAYSYSAEETIAIINAAEGWHRLFLRTLAESGCRPGELCGLLRSNVKARALAITQSVWQGNVQSPKSTNSVREFAISAPLGRDLLKYIDETDDNPLGLVFVRDGYRTRKVGQPGKGGRFSAEQMRTETYFVASDVGKPISADSFRTEVLEPILDRLGILAKVKASGKRCGLYGLRHGNATLMDSLGTPLATRQKRLGHAPGSQVTLRNYTHSLGADDLATADAIGALLNTNEERVQ